MKSQRSPSALVPKASLSWKAGALVLKAAAEQPAETPQQSPLLSSPAASASVIDAHLRSIFQDELPQASAEQPAEASERLPRLPKASAEQPAEAPEQSQWSPCRSSPAGPLVPNAYRSIFQDEFPKASAKASQTVPLAVPLASFLFPKASASVQRPPQRPFLLPIPSVGAAHHYVTCAAGDAQTGHIIIMNQEEPNGRVTQFVMKLERAIVLREAGEPLPIISPVPTDNDDDDVTPMATDDGLM